MLWFVYNIRSAISHHITFGSLHRIKLPSGARLEPGNLHVAVNAVSPTHRSISFGFFDLHIVRKLFIKNHNALTMFLRLKRMNKQLQTERKQYRLQPCINIHIEFL